MVLCRAGRFKAGREAGEVQPQLWAQAGIQRVKPWECVFEASDRFGSVHKAPACQQK